MTPVLIQILFTTLGFLVIIILYKVLLRKFSKGRVIHSQYCTLYSVDENPSKEVIEFYFECPSDLEVTFFIRDSQENEVFSKKGNFDKGGHILRFDSREVENGNYVYGIKTFEQETIKKLLIKN